MLAAVKASGRTSGKRNHLLFNLVLDYGLSLPEIKSSLVSFADMND
jgi:hypothetical protein